MLAFVDAHAHSSSTSVILRENYNNWGWKSYVMSNGLITLAVVPQIGGRVMQYDLAGHPSIWVNPAEFGNTYEPSASSSWHNYGGYKVWPAPQKEWITTGGGWPPPPNLDFGTYSCRIIASSPDSSTIHLESPIETLEGWKCVGLGFRRRLTIYRDQTRVKVEQTIVNHGKRPVMWGVWDVTQLVVNHPGEEDWGNFWVYFPIKKNSRFGPKGYYIMGGRGNNPQWKANLTEGISAVQYLHRSGKIGSDSDGGWIAYVDQRDGYLYAKGFPYYAEGTYPDSGATIEVFTSGGDPYLEVEVLSPLIALTPGDSFTFVENWYATKFRGTVLEVNRAAAVGKRLSVDIEANFARLRGEYGVFSVGDVEIIFRDSRGTRIGSAGSFRVSPLQVFTLDVTAPLPPKSQRVDLELCDTKGRWVGRVDSRLLSTP